MRQSLSRLVGAFVRLLLRATLRAAVTGLIFAGCFVAALSYMGVPLPGLYEWLERFEGVSRLAGILS